MLKITIPNNNIAERKYILDIIFDEFLGLEYKVEARREKGEGDWEIELENGSKLIFKDHFFNKYLNNLEYLKQMPIYSITLIGIVNILEIYIFSKKELK